MENKPARARLSYLLLASSNPQMRLHKSSTVTCSGENPASAMLMQVLRGVTQPAVATRDSPLYPGHHEVNLQWRRSQKCHIVQSPTERRKMWGLFSSSFFFLSPLLLLLREDDPPTPCCVLSRGQRHVVLESAVELQQLRRLRRLLFLLLLERHLKGESHGDGIDGFGRRSSQQRRSEEKHGAVTPLLPGNLRETLASTSLGPPPHKPRGLCGGGPSPDSWRSLRR